ncbi:MULTISPECIES: GNAT family N-acetyltransferase [unclassified Arenibacter]|jgi:carbonic anhydrase|uniref:GNAT family N-acetyltransferase n=1 Tax=unclassified Arenibacter TaxID=2615047 RepID=UPI000E340AB6|nr:MULTISPECIES: GNAT family N-acetyltransferase [unclassified Arenibacter]MCM4164296.1 GNAT family N-acetyltransferase [Arenibacter sp. A80]RFT56080.1 GNAT family N-acetyltransferase [Arenibacter sp. P308M17]
MIFNIQLKLAQTASDFAQAKKLILEYVAWLGIDLSFQNFDKEMETLPKMYGPNEGGLFIAFRNGEAVGIAGLRKFNGQDAELKRMYVRPESRGLGIGQLLLSACMETAKKLNYKSIKLDTADFMKSAIKLYTDNGFVEIGAYRHNPHESARYFELKLITE